MKKMILLFALFVACQAGFASFPVNKQKLDKVIAKIEIEKQSAVQAPSQVAQPVVLSEEGAVTPAAASEGMGKGQITLLALWFFLGGLAAHRWYAKKPAGWNILFILTLGGLGVWWIIDGINILSDKF